MSKTNKKEPITMIYSFSKDIDEENSEVENEGGGFWSKIKRKFKKDRQNYEERNDYDSLLIKDTKDDIADEIAKDQDVIDIKKNIGSDQIFDEICAMPLKQFKSSLSKLNSLSIEDEIYIIKKLNEESNNYNIEDIAEKTITIVKMNNDVLDYDQNIVLKIVRYGLLERIIEEFKLSPIEYKISEQIPFSNKRSILFFENGLLKAESDLELDIYPVQKIKQIAGVYGKEYVQPFLAGKFKRANFISFGEIKELLNLGLDVNTLDSMSRNALWYIRETEDLNLLKEKGINLNHLDSKGENFVFEYISQISSFNYIEKDVLENVSKMSVNINTINNKGENILFAAARKNIKCLHFLLNLNMINCFQLNNKGENILFYIDDKKTIEVLVNNVGFDINIINNYGETLLFNRSFETVAMLIELGANKKAKDFTGKTYLDME